MGGMSVSPTRMTTLDPNEKAVFTLTITPPTDASPQDYLVNVTATSNEMATDEQSSGSR